MERKDELTILGKTTAYKQDYAPEVLEAFTNKHPENDYWVRFNCPEFTSLCPITGQPDFAEIRISYLPDITAVHRRLPDSVSHSTAYRKRIAFCDSLMDISLWFDARYAAGRNRFRILRRRSSVALWVLSWEGPVGEYVTRWRRDVAACPRLALCPEGPGLLVKKILFRRKKQHL